MGTSEPEFTERDLTYLTGEYLTLERLCDARAETPGEVRELVGEGRLPRPPYVLPDGTELFPPDYFVVLDDAGGLEKMRGHFEQRHRAASSAIGLVIDPDEDWRGYLAGEYAVCLREVTPEAMVEKAALIAEIDMLTAVPAVEDEQWRSRLRDAVDALDEIERPFTDYDRQRWGTTSRDTHVTAVRARYLE
jgi:hypothetical protein